MARALRIVLLALAALVLVQWWSSRHEVTPEPVPTGAESSARAPSAAGYPGFLPTEAVETLRAIEQGGPFPYERDGVAFQNRERLLPERPRGYYREYTVPTPGENDRGARRIVTGGNPPEVYYYTADHYRSFRKVEIQR
jgi:guanyl-specific ribonuclease Sa